MVKGSKKPDLISYEEILRRTGGGYDIFMAYEGKVEKRMKRPWPGPKGRVDNHPSWGISVKNGVCFWKDHATEESGTAVEYVMRKFGLTFGEAIKKILWDFGWGGGEVNSKPVVINWERKIEEEPVHITFTSQVFKKKHHAFWNKVEVQEADCKRLECWAVKDLAVNRKKYNLKKDEVVFAYYAPEEDKCKIYFPEREKDRRFINNVSYFYLWNIRNIKKCPDLIVQKSYKDLIVTSMLTPCVTATQAEAVQIFNEETVQYINSLADNIWVFYGSDPDGVKKCKEITSTHNWKYINTPKNLLPDINDTYGYVEKFHLKGLEEFMKSKKFPL